MCKFILASILTMYLVPFLKFNIEYWFFLEIRVTGHVIQGMAPYDRACGTSDQSAVVSTGAGSVRTVALFC